MRGTALLTVLLMFAIVVAFAVGFSIRFNLFGGGEGGIHKTSLQSHVYTQGHALDAARSYESAALRFSVYQACYDLLGGRGGDGIRSIESLLAMTEEAFYEGLGSLTEENLGKYNERAYRFLSDYSVVMPDSSVQVVPGGPGGGFEVLTKPSGKLATTRIADSGESITLRASAEVSEAFDMQCYGLVMRGQEEAEQLSQWFRQGFAEVFEGLEEGSSCSTIESCKEELTSGLREGLGSLIAGRPEDDIELEIIDASVTVTRVERIGQAVDRAYEGEASLEVTIREEDVPPEHHYPVWNGTAISFEPLEMVFSVEASASSQA